MKKKFAVRFPGLRECLSAFFVLALFPVAAMADGPAPHEHTARHEVDFIQHTLDHHLQAIRMSETCTQNAFTPELVELCNTMLQAHQAESDQLQAWLQEWYGEDHEPHLAPAQQAQVDRLGTLTEGEFERNFLQDMVPHHMAGIKESAKCAAQFYHEELIDLCTTSTAAQAEEIRSMRALLRDGYGINGLEVRENPVAEPLMDEGGDDGEGEGDDTPDDDTPDDDGGDDGMGG